MYSALRTLSRIQSDGVIEIHAIGGAITTTCYFNAFPAADIDAFIFSRREMRSARLLAERLVEGEWPKDLD